MNPRKSLCIHLSMFQANIIFFNKNCINVLKEKVTVKSN